MNLSTEAKVGAVSLLAFLLLAYMVVHLGDFSFGEKGYPLKAVFSQVGGLKEGNTVRYAGVDVGRVVAVRPANDGVEVVMRINSGIKIPEGSKFTIGTDGLLGEKFINIVPPKTSGGHIKPHTVVAGEDPNGLDQLVNNADKVLADVQKLVQSLNDVLGDETVKAALKASVLNARDVTQRLNEFSAVLARLAQNNEQDINVIVGNLSAMSGSLKDVAGRVDKLVANIDNNGQTAKDLRETIHNLKNTSIRVEKIAAALEGVATDPETAKNIKETLRNAREVSEKANKMLTKVNDVSVETGFEVLYNTHSSEYRSNADIKINTSKQDFAIIGVSKIGEENKGNFQIGRGDGQFAGRAGLIDGKAGIGADARIGGQMRLGLDIYDPNDIRVKLRAQFKLGQDTYLVGQTDSLNKNPEQSTYVGIRRTF
jgi:phospholipid/cholesterol/gamma-HCH transport system substrate-binding protein